ncbi:unnamed protein product [Mycena citricolor]|uniref:DUF6534 domain-containing protein n=1 Tax=Mycena citricolor TaxID=2018698 RepID=A0AAD2H836_9AGAR|nr:unnamed protein product [Mycena citricolor]
MGEYDTRLGALCVAYMLAWGLYGVMSIQSYRYYHIFVKDPLWIKTLVGGLWVLETLQLALIGSFLYFWVITNYANPAILADTTWTYNIGILVTNTIVIIVQLSAAASLLSDHADARAAVSSLVVSGFLVKVELFYKFQTTASVGLGRTGMEVTDSVVNKLILYAMNTGTLTAIVVLVDMVCVRRLSSSGSSLPLKTAPKFLTMPKNLIHIAFNVVSGKLYTNSLLATLNYRDTVRSQIPHATNRNTTISLSPISATMAPTVGAGPVFATNSKFDSSVSAGGHSLVLSTSEIEDDGIPSASELKIIDAV